MEEQTYIIEIESVSPADANRYAEELRDALRGATSKIKVEQRRTDASAQDFGATLVLILGAPAVIVVANAFRDWINRRDNAKVTLKTSKGEILMTGVTSRNAYKILELFKSMD